MGADGVVSLFRYDFAVRDILAGDTAEGVASVFRQFRFEESRFHVAVQSPSLIRIGG